ncbi:unnamed protein product [Symbiodinium natans]|uniref:Uncharacterized protein n=1 Tax=Symbiodinium natans TaxID=878477 RepID=A0A812VFA1_9DINO|nr:unnamed protein product [Symbiodinium natans]
MDCILWVVLACTEKLLHAITSRLSGHARCGDQHSHCPLPLQFTPIPQALSCSSPCSVPVIVCRFLFSSLSSSSPLPVRLLLRCVNVSGAPRLSHRGPPGICCTISGELLIDGACHNPPPGHCVYEDGRCFAVLPCRAADDSDMGTDMVKDFDDNWLDIPAGWKPYEACQDFDQVVLPKVIAGHAWGTDMVLVRRGNKWPGWKTGIRGAAAGAGKRLSSHIEWFETDSSGRKCVFRAEDPQRTPSKKLDPLWRSWSGRVLLERVPDSTRIEAFKALLHLQALESARDEGLADCL